MRSSAGRRRTLALGSDASSIGSALPPRNSVPQQDVKNGPPGNRQAAADPKVVTLPPKRPAEVKVLKKRVEALKFSASETPEKWSYKMQLLLNMWKRIPADKRGGTIADLSDTLLDKVLEVRRVYTSARAYTLEARLRWRGLDDVTGLPWPEGPATASPNTRSKQGRKSSSPRDTEE